MKFKKLFTWLIAGFLLAVVGTANATNYDYWAEVHYIDRSKAVGNMDTTRITSGITFKVLDVGTDTGSTLTQIGSTTSLTNPVTTTNFESATVCNDRVTFRSTASTCDLIVTNVVGGYSAVIEDFSPSMHKIVLDQTKGIMHHGIIWASSNSAVATDTGIDFAPDTFVHDVRVEVVTVDAGETIDVGSGSTAAGYRSAVSVATAGYVADTAVVTNGTSQDYTAASTYGTLLVTAITGIDSTDRVGGKSYLGHIITDAATDADLYYTESSSGDAFAGYIHYWFTRMR
jgi:hypothetical protein